MNNDIKQLNTALKGEYMAIDGFDHYIQDTDDQDLKKKLMKMQQQHRFHTIQLSERIQQLGGDPINSSGVLGAITETWYKVSQKKYVDGSIVKSALEGEKMGLESYGEIYENLSDPANKMLAKEMMTDCVKIVEELNKMLN